VCYRSGQPVVWGGHSGDLARFEWITPVIRRPLPEMFEELGVRYLLLDHRYACPEDLHLAGLVQSLGDHDGFEVLEYERRRPLQAEPAGPQISAATASLSRRYPAVTALFGHGEWLDGLAYRLLAHRSARRPAEEAQADSIHFFVGSLGLGGTQRQLATLVRFLVGRGYRCKVWVQNEGGRFAGEIVAAGATWESLFEPPEEPERRSLTTRLWRRLRARSHTWTALALAARLRRDRPTVLQCFLDTANVAGALAGRMAGVPVVVAGLRNVPEQSRSPAAVWRFQQRCYRLLRPPLVDAVVANSEAGRACFLRQQAGLGPATVHVVPNGLDPPRFSSGTDAEVRRDLGLGPEVPVVLWAGRLEPEKRLDVFLRACAVLGATDQDFVALVAGEGAAYEPMLALAAVLGLSDRVRFMGYRGDVPDLIRLARAVALTSEIEGFPNILLETQLAGRPVVATRAGGTGEVVEPGVTGFLVEVGDRDAVAGCLARLLRDSVLASRLGGAGAERARRLFPGQRMGEETLAIYRELAEKRGVRFQPVETGACAISALTT
jgi:glycosyltransferase involved in cell wall biosynthesis